MRIRQPRPSDRERGATLVETAMVLPLLVMLVFGIIDFGAIFNDKIAMRQGAREGARQVVTGNIGNDTTSCNVEGGTSNTSVHQLVCLVKNRSDLPASRIRVALNIEGCTSLGPCAAYTATPKRSLKICTMAQLSSISGFFGAILNGKVTKTDVQMKTEQLTTELTPTPKQALENFQETPFPGQTWDCLAATT
jgi:hypothetical protein